MRRMRLVAAAVVVVMCLAAPASASATATTTLHGTFTCGQYFSGTTGVLESCAAAVEDGTGMAAEGDWNVNISFVGDTPRVVAQFVVRKADPDHGLHALWTPSSLRLTPLWSESSVADLIGPGGHAVYDPAHGIYAFTGDVGWATVVAIVDTTTRSFAYAGVTNPGVFCAPDAGPTCLDSVRVVGVMGR